MKQGTHCPLDLHLEIKTDVENLPTKEDFLLWAETALAGKKSNAELSICLVSASEIEDLNKDYRGIEKPTNVLAFPATVPEELKDEVPLLGDIIICPAVIEQEAAEQGKALIAHWAHIVIHAVLHLLGYDHLKENEAEAMEALEICLLEKLGYANPYEETRY